MYLDPILPSLVTILFSLLATGVALRSLRRPFMTAGLAVIGAAFQVAIRVGCVAAPEGLAR